MNSQDTPGGDDIIGGHEEKKEQSAIGRPSVENGEDEETILQSHSVVMGKQPISRTLESSALTWQNEDSTAHTPDGTSDSCQGRQQRRRQHRILIDHDDDDKKYCLPTSSTIRSLTNQDIGNDDEDDDDNNSDRPGAFRIRGMHYSESIADTIVTQIEAGSSITVEQQSSNFTVTSASTTSHLALIAAELAPTVEDIVRQVEARIQQTMAFHVLLQVEQHVAELFVPQQQSNRINYEQEIEEGEHPRQHQGRQGQTAQVPVAVHTGGQAPRKHKTNKDRSTRGSTSHQKHLKQRATIAFLCLLVFVVVGVLVGTIASTMLKSKRKNKSKNDDSTDDTWSQETMATTTPGRGTDILANQTITKEPTYAPTAFQTNRFEQLIEVLGSIVVLNRNYVEDAESQNDDFAVFRDTSTVQYQAIDWLANHDAWLDEQIASRGIHGYDYEIDSLFLEEDDEQENSILLSALVERYALAVLYFSMTGWNFLQLNFLSPTSVCQWRSFTVPDEDNGRNGIICSLQKETVVEIHLADCHLVGKFPTELTLLTNLVSLNFNDNHGITGALPQGNDLLRWSNIQHLLLSNMALTGTIPSTIFSGSFVGHLETIYLSGNYFSGTMPSFLEIDYSSTSSSSHVLKYLDVSNNVLTGTLAADYGQLTQLISLALGSNSGISGPIPTALGQLTDLLFLVLDYCQFSGTIPTELGQLSLMQVLYLDQNSFSGWIPTEFGQLTSTNYLYLNSNRLSGPIPSELGQLTGLRHLSLHDNQLEGTIPEALSNVMRELELLSMEDNRLTGNLDPILCQSLDNNGTSLLMGEVWADCGGNNSQLNCSCCAWCCDDEGECVHQQ